MIRRFIHQLNQPFPDSCDPKKFVVQYLAIATFIGLFLYVFQPFGLFRYPYSKELLCLGFAGITLGVGLVYESIQTYVFKVDRESPKWTLGKWIINSIIIVLLIAIGNYLYVSMIDGFDYFEPRLFILFIRNTFAVGIFPIVFSGLIAQRRKEQVFEKEAADIVPPAEVNHEEALVIPSTNANEELQLLSGEVLFLQAMENYVAVHLVQSGQPDKQLVRNTLTAVEHNLPEHFIKCHRSYIVNLDRIDQVTGNAQGLKLSLKGSSRDQVPVSRKYIPKLKAVLNH